MVHAARCKHRTQKLVKKSPSGHHRTTLSGYISATNACIDNRKKNLLSSNISSTCSHNIVNFGPLAAEIGPVVWGTPASFSGFRVLASLFVLILVGWCHLSHWHRLTRSPVLALRKMSPVGDFLWLWVSTLSLYTALLPLVGISASTCVGYHRQR